MKLPKAKLENVVVQDLKGELLVYNLTTHKAYTLNETSKIVFESCDGETSFDELKRQHKFTDDLIYLALDELKANDLLVDYQSSHFGSLSRREVIRRVGLTCAVALPVIAGIIAPRAAHAASQTFAAGSRNVNESCNTSTDCNQADARNCVTVRGQSSTGKACCRNNTAQPVYLNGGDPNGGGAVNYASQSACENSVSPQCCSRVPMCNCTNIGNGAVRCTSFCQ